MTMPVSRRSGNVAGRIVAVIFALFVLAAIVYFGVDTRQPRTQPGDQPDTSSVDPMEIPGIWLDLRAEPETFDDRLAASPIVGCTRTDGGCQVVFNPLDRKGVICRPGALRTILDPEDRWLVDVENTVAAFPMSLVLSDEMGQVFTLLNNVPASLGRSTLEFPVAYLAEKPGGVALGDVRTFQLTYALEELERTLVISIDNLRISREGAVETIPADATIALPKPDPESFLPDGGFDLGLLTWRVRRYPAAQRTVGLVTGDEAYEGGPSLGLFKLTTGSVALVSAELVLEPGNHDLDVAIRGRGDPYYLISREELREDGEWVEVRSRDHTPRRVPDSWSVISHEIAIGRNGPVPRTARIVIEARGDGDVYLDAIRLTSRDGALPEAGRFDLGLASPDASAGVAARFSWNGAAFEDRGEPLHPIFFRDDDLPLDDASRRFGEGCRRLGLPAAVDLGGAYHGSDLALVPARALRRRDDEGVALWLLSGDVNWPLLGTVPARARGAVQALAARDSRLVAVGVGVEWDPLVYYNFAGAADVVVVGSPAPRVPDAETLQRFGDAVAATARALAGAGNGSPGAPAPILAHLDARSSAAMLGALAHVAWLNGARGIVLGRFQRQVDYPASPRTVDWRDVEALVDLVRERGEALTRVERYVGHATPAGPIIYRRVTFRGGGRGAIAVNLSSGRVDAAELDLGGGAVERVSFEPWQGLIVEARPDEAR